MSIGVGVSISGNSYKFSRYLNRCVLDIGFIFMFDVKIIKITLPDGCFMAYDRENVDLVLLKCLTMAL